MSSLPNYVHFLPWQGRSFTEQDRRLLILGESHYSDQAEDREFTRQLTEEYASGLFNHRFWTQIGQAVTGKRHWEIDRRVFWNQIAFYNFVQVIAADRPRQAPTAEMFRQSEGAFFEVLDDLQPTHLLALGYRLWTHMPQLVDENLKFNCDDIDYQFGEYRRTWGHVLAMSMQHPSTAFSAPRWHPVVRKFLTMRVVS